jgi:hypothetical protein
MAAKPTYIGQSKRTWESELLLVPVIRTTLQSTGNHQGQIVFLFAQPELFGCVLNVL